MNTPACNLCGGEVKKEDSICPHCATPIHPDTYKSPQKRFLVFFICVVLFCLFVIYWLPPDWRAFMDK